MPTGYIDYGVSKIATHSFSEDSLTKAIERIAPAAGIVDSCNWGTDAFTMNAIGTSAQIISVIGKGRIIVLARASASNVVSGNTYIFKLLFFAADGGYMGASLTVSPPFGSEDDNDAINIYATPIVFANDIGAAHVKIALSGLPGTATSMSLMVKAI